ncbi:NAD(P)/FAD-dependent oxidoreductase [Zavarzinia aquatilis]|uniref:FAD-dependent oxidoreductase n=1 Tax=Zavarzinia aquatilis TaxID=2211142 RepID=A0A317EEL5_9PROT|nr:FAD-dependent oxidoreductase [Zavarzinia aquatilis]PWR25062.1 FAD-dependent oxidoreductase [Zavarzinia aquatilis]
MSASLHHPSIHDYRQPVPSWWAASAGVAPSAPRLDGELKVDVAVIGGGVTGLNAGIAIVREGGLSAAVLDAAPIGWGASGRNGGFCCLGSAKLSWPAIIRRFGLAEAQAFFRLQVAAIAHVRQLLAEFAIDAEAGPEGEAVIAHHPRAVEGLAEEAALYAQAFDTPCRVLSLSEVKERGLFTAEAAGALLVPHGFPLHPLKYVQGLARAAADAGVKLHGESPVVGWSREGHRHRLTTPTGSVLADRVAVATAGFTRESLHPGLSGRLLPVLSNIIVTRPLTAAERAEQRFDTLTMCADTRHLLHYFRLLPDGRLMFGARGGISAAPAAEDAMKARLRGDLARMFPAFARAETAYFWRGLTDLTFDLLPHFGTLDDESAHFLLGFHGNGVAMGSFGGSLLGRRVAGLPVDLPSPVSRPLRRFPLPWLRQTYLRAAYIAFSLRDGVGK